MKELMLELLTYEPYGRLISGEKDYIYTILSGNYHQPKSKFHDLFSGFYDYVQNGNFKNIGWPQSWMKTYHQNQNYTQSTKNGRVYYPLLFKKICFYIIVQGNFSNKAFMGEIGLSGNLIKKWDISPKFRKYAEADSYSIIRTFRSGVKKPYIVSLSKRCGFSEKEFLV